MVVDSHAHLSDPKIADNLDEIILKAKEKGVNYIISIGCSLDEAIKTIEIANKYQNIFACIGLYPQDSEAEKYSKLNIEKRLELLSSLAANPKVVGIGECGLDFTDPPPWEKKRSEADQIKLFEAQIKLAKSLRKPIVIHSRGARNLTVETLYKHYKNEASLVNGVWHCFTEDYDTAQEIISLGFFVSASGILSYPNAKDIRQTFKKISLKNIVLETDSPFLPPDLIRKKGIKLNTPGNVIYTAKILSEIKNKPIEEIFTVTTNNVFKLFNIPTNKNK